MIGLVSRRHGGTELWIPACIDGAAFKRGAFGERFIVACPVAPGHDGRHDAMNVVGDADASPIEVSMVAHLQGLCAAGDQQVLAGE